MGADIDLVEVAEASGLRGYLRGVRTIWARKLLAGFVAELERRRWTDAAQLPDVDVTLQLYDQAASEPVWPGYYDGERWRYVDGTPATPTHYANMPPGPYGHAPGAPGGAA